MPSLVRVSGEETIRKLEKLGFKRVRQAPRLWAYCLLRIQSITSVILFHEN